MFSQLTECKGSVQSDSYACAPIFPTRANSPFRQGSKEAYLRGRSWGLRDRLVRVITSSKVTEDVSSSAVFCNAIGATQLKNEQCKSEFNILWTNAQWKWGCESRNKHCCILFILAFVFCASYSWRGIQECDTWVIQQSVMIQHAVKCSKQKWSHKYKHVIGDKKWFCDGFFAPQQFWAEVMFFTKMSKNKLLLHAKFSQCKRGVFPQKAHCWENCPFHATVSLVLCVPC